MSTAPQSMRDEFEAYLGDGAGRDDYKTFGDGEYLDPATQADWELWQAATTKEREACAVVGDAMAVEYRALYKGRTEPIDRAALYDPHMDGMSDGASNVADAIRERGKDAG